MVSVVVIGGSYAATKAVRAVTKNGDAKVTVVAKNEKAYFNCAAPRLLIEPDQVNKTLYPLKDVIREVSNGKAELVTGEVTAADLDAQTVQVSTKAGVTELKYDFLIVASGSRSQWAGYKVNDSHEEAVEALKAANKEIKTAKAVGIFGGGPTGIETAGEVALRTKAKVTLYTGDKAPLATQPRLLSAATQKLEALGVTVVNGVRYTLMEKTAQGTTVQLDNGETKTFDTVFTLTREEPYSQFLPDSVKNNAGYVVTDEHLVVKGHRNVFAIGDVVQGTGRSVVDISYGQTKVLTATVNKVVYGKGSLVKYTPVTNTIAVPISTSGGVGLVFGFWAPNFLIKFLKSRHFMIPKGRSTFD